MPHFSWASRLLPEDQATLFAVFIEAMADRRAFSVKARFRRADGAVRQLMTKAEPRFAPNGAFLGMVGVNIDVSDEV